MPPARVRGRLERRPKAAAAVAATIRMVKVIESTLSYRGASSTPASPARKLDSTHATDPTRSALTPASSAIRGLSTTARIRSPRAL
jgi:hypothetical protein